MGASGSANSASIWRHAPQGGLAAPFKFAQRSPDLESRVWRIGFFRRLFGFFQKVVERLQLEARHHRCGPYL